MVIVEYQVKKNSCSVFVLRNKKIPHFFANMLNIILIFLYIIVVGGRFHGEKIFET